MRARKLMGPATLVLLVTALAAWLLPGLARAELRVDLTPPAVTAPNRALVVMEASSLHWAAHLLYEDEVERRSVHVSYSAGLRDSGAEGALFGADLHVSDEDGEEYLADGSQSLLRIAQGVRLRDYRLSENAGNEFPTPVVQYTVRIRTRDARALRLMLEAHAANWGERFSVDGFNALGRLVFSEALRHTRIRQRASNEVLPWEAVGVFDTTSALPTDLEGIPGLSEEPLVPVHDIDGERHATPLAFLYAAMLAGERSYDEARVADGIAGAEGLSGCRLPDSFSVSQSALDAADADLLSAAIAGGPDRGGATAPYMILMKRAQRLDRDAAILLDFARARLTSGVPNPSDAAAALLAADVLLDGKAVLDQAFWENPEVVEAFVLGHIDPATIPVWRCMALRAARGVVEPTRFIAARNVAYAEFDAMLGQRSWRAMLRDRPAEVIGAPRFFAAAHNVTRFLGVGLVDAVELYGSPEAQFDQFAAMAFDASCAGWGSRLPQLVPAERERRFLRDINFHLYRNVNVPVMGELLRTGVLFDPMTWGPLPHDTPEGATLAFDLRMVLTEQGVIEARIGTALENGDYGLDDPAAWERLTNSQIALYCSRLGDIARAANPDPEAQFQIVERLKSMLDALTEAGVVGPEDRSFRSYLWRVATGSAYVHVLHGANEAAFVDYMTRLEDEMATAPGTPLRLQPGLQQELTALVERAPDRDPESERRWTEALATYLHPTAEPLRLFDCEGPTPSVELSVTGVDGPLLPRAARIEALDGSTLAGAAMDGLGPVAVAFDLSASGEGALLPDARIAGPAEDAVAACDAIRSRREALEELITGADSMMPLLDFAEVDRLLVLDRSVRLAETQGRIEPFLVAALRAESAVPSEPEAWTRGDLRALVEGAFETAADYQRDVAIARRLAALPPGQFNLLGLEMAQSDVAALGQTAALATTPDAGTRGEAGSAIEQADGLETRIARVAENRNDLSGLRAALCRALEACAGTPDEDADTGRGPLRPIPVSYPYPELTEEEVARGIGHNADLPPGSDLVPDLTDREGAIAGSALYYRITPTDRLDGLGRPVEEAELVYRLPRPAGAMMAEVVETQVRETPNNLPELEGLAALSQVQEIPLGVTFTRTVLNAETGLRELENVNDFLLVLSRSDLDAAAHALGLPDWIGIRQVDERGGPDGESSIDGLREVTLNLDIDLLGTRVPGWAPLPLVRDGRFVDPGQALRTALVGRVEAAAADHLDAIVADLGLMRFPADREDYEAARVRFGPGGERAVDVRFDWNSGALTASLDYHLDVDSEIFRAVVDLLVAPDGSVSIRNARFVDDAADLDIWPALRSVEELEAIIDRVEGIASTLTRAQAEVDDVATTLRATPVITADQVAILLRQTVSVTFAGQDCPLTFQARLLLDLSGAAEAVTAAVEDTLGDQLASCATEVPTRHLFNALADLEAEPEIDLFGTRATLGFGNDGELSPEQASALLDEEPGRLPVQLDIDQSRSGCREPLNDPVRGGALVVADTGLRLDVRNLPPEEAAKLARAMACAVDGFLPEAVREFVEFDHIDVLGGEVLIDATVRGLPFLSEVPLRRITLSDPTVAAATVAGVFEQIAFDALESGLDAALRDAFGGGRMELAGIGSFAVEAPRVERGGTRWWIALEGTLFISGFEFPQTTVRIPVGGLLSDVDVRMPGADDVLGSAIAQAAIDLLPIAPETPRIHNAFFGPLDARGTLYGLRFDMTAGFPLGDYSINVRIRRASLSLEGLRLGGEITAALPLPLYFGPVALSQVLFTIVTGEETGTRPRLRLGADLTAVEPQFARVLKLRSQLDLTELERLAFTLTSDVIALDTITLMEAEGRLDLANAYASFDAGATGVIADIIDPQMVGRLDGRAGLVYARSSLDVFGEEISGNELELCSSECETNGTPGEARIAIAQNLLLGEADGGARTDLGFRDPSLAAGVDLDLFGWKPGGARFAVDLGGAELNLRFLGIGVTILTPSYQTMDPSFVARVLKDLLKVDLSSLLDVDPADITISLMSPSGDVSSPSQNTETGSRQAADPGDADEQRNSSGATSVAPEAEEDPQAGPPRPEDIVPPQETWGTAVTARVCERYVGPADAGAIPPDPDHLYFIYGALETDDDPAWLWRPWSSDIPDWYTWPTLSGIAANELCTVQAPIGVVHRWQIPQEVVSLGAARWVLWRETTCNPDGSPSVTVRPLNELSQDPDERARFRNAGLPLLCIETPQGHRIQVESRLYVDTRDRPEIVLVPYCPARTRGWVPDGPLGEVFVRLCRTEGARLERFPVAESGFKFGEEIEVISAQDELRFYEQTVYPRILGTGVPAERGREQWVSDDGTFRATPDEIVRGGQVARVTFLVERTGEDGLLGTARLDRLNVDGTPNLLFDLYLRAKPNDGNTMWRVLFMELFRLSLETGEPPNFVTTDVATANRIAIRAPQLDLEHAYAIRWLWFDESGLNSRLSYLPSRLPRLDGPPPDGLLGYGRDELEALALRYLEPQIAHPGEEPLRVMFGMTRRLDWQQVVVFADPACAPVDLRTSGQCPDSVSHAAEDTVLQITIVSHRENRVGLSNWITAAGHSFTGCISKRDLVEDLALVMDRPPSPGDVDDLFFGLDELTERMPDLTAAPERVFAEMRPCT